MERNKMSNIKLKQLENKAMLLTADDLKEQLIKYVNDTSDYVEILFSVMLTALESKVSDREFCEFATELELLMV